MSAQGTLPGRQRSSHAAHRTSHSKRVLRRGLARGAVLTAVGKHAGIGTILLLTTALDFVRLQRTGYNNLYYAAGVRSMLQNWHNFFFVSFDPAGFVSIDKPPLGLWVQAASARLFGFRGVSLVLPQAVAGVLSVALVYGLVRRTCGEMAALLAALILAISPINVATNRNNTMDAQLVLVLLVAAWAVTRASEQASRHWLTLGFVLVGVGFNIKMLQAFLVLPAFSAVYFFTTPSGWRQRVVDLGVASAALLLTSLAWVVAVDATPPQYRPFVGGSSDNRDLNLAFGHNGVARLVGSPGLRQAQDIGSPGPLRFLNPLFAGQISWFLPLAVAGLLLFLAARPWQQRPMVDRRHRAIVLWGVWLLTQIVFFSGATFFQLYYLVMLSPAIAALTGIALSQLWHARQRSRWQRLLLPLCLAVTAALHCWIVLNDAPWNRWIIPPLLVLSTLSILGLTGAWSRVGRAARGLPAFATTIGLLGLLIGPAVWSVLPVWNARASTVPIAGPSSSADRGAGITPRDVTFVVAFLEAHRAGAQYLVATLTSNMAAPLIVASGQPVMTVGGYKGRDNIISIAQLDAAIARGAVRYFLLPPGSLTAPGTRPFPADRIATWVRSRCTLVAGDQWRAPAGLDNAMADSELYNCAGGSQT